MSDDTETDGLSFMLCMLLALGVLAFWTDAPKEWMDQRNARTVMKSLGVLCALGILFMGAFSIFETNPSTSPWAFRKGQLIPKISEDDSENPKIVVYYLQKSWWNWKKDGKWFCKYDPSRGWVYWDENAWKDVPSEVYEEPDMPNKEMDNRGSYEP